MLRWTRLVACSVLAGLLPLSAAIAQQLYPDDQLVGTIWRSEGPFVWTSVDHGGAITQRTSDGNFVEFLGHRDGVYVFTINWWNEEAGVNVVEHGVMVSDGENSYVMLEAEATHPGITGDGFFRIIDADSAAMTQIGRLDDGSAAAFATPLMRVETPPAVPLPQSHPTR